MWRRHWNEEEDDEERDEIILVLVIYGFGFEEIYGMRRKMTKKEMGNYFGFGLGLCSYVLFWFVLEKAEHGGRERAVHRDLEDCYYVFFFLMLFF